MASEAEISPGKKKALLRLGAVSFGSDVGLRRRGRRGSAVAHKRGTTERYSRDETSGEVITSRRMA